MDEQRREKTNSEEERDSGRQNSTRENSTSREIEIPAIRHIGPTLESDPEFNAVTSPGYSTPEAQIANEAGRSDVDQRRMEEDDFDPLSGRTLENRPERLKTRLPGDTSSDPHSDVGPDNATNLQNRNETK